jgi:hypothetical protein
MKGEAEWSLHRLGVMSVFEVFDIPPMSLIRVLTTSISLTKDVGSEQRPSWRSQLWAKIRVSTGDLMICVHGRLCSPTLEPSEGQHNEPLINVKVLRQIRSEAGCGRGDWLDIEVIRARLLH